MPSWRTSSSDASVQAALATRTAESWVDIDALEVDMLAVLNHRIAHLGPDGSGLGPYYSRQIEAGAAFNPGDRMLLKLLATDFYEFDRVVEAGAGYGQLGLALAAFGRQVHLIEAASERHACIEALKSALALKYPRIATNATVVHGRWPSAPSDITLARALLVAVDFVFTVTEDQVTAATDALAWYGGAIFDGSHFITSRLTPDVRAEFYDALTYRGLSAPLHLPSHVNARNSDFVFVTPRGAGRSGPHRRHFIDV